MRTRTKILLGLAAYLALVGAALLIFGNEGRNPEFQPQEEYRLEPWIGIEILGVDLSVTRAVFYLALASVLTIAVLSWISTRMEANPGRVQAALELAYDLTRNNITRGNIPDERLARRWFPFLATLFFFIAISNVIGYLPLPTNTRETVGVLGIEIPTFALYAATANLSVPLALTLLVWISYHVEGVRRKGLVPYLRSWLPPGLEEMNPLGKGAIFVIEVISQFVRLISLSVRLFANILAGHLLLLFMGGGLAVLLGLAALGLLTYPLAFAFYIFEIGLVATLQAFIFATLAAIYLGAATSAEH